MKSNFRWLIGTCFFAIANALFAQEVIPDEFSAMAVEAPGSYEFVKACMPSVSESSFNQAVREAASNKTVTNWPADKTMPYLTVARGRAYCVKMSIQKNPILPLAAFDDTIDFPDMPKEEVRRMRIDLSRQLAIAGIATALVVNEKGNAYQIAYLLSSNTPSKFYYRAGFLTKGEFDERHFRSVYRSVGTISVTGRGQPSEYFKPFF